MNIIDKSVSFSRYDKCAVCCVQETVVYEKEKSTMLKRHCGQNRCVEVGQAATELQFSSAGLHTLEIVLEELGNARHQVETCVSA